MGSNFIDLPSEVLYSVFANLCYHCRWSGSNTRPLNLWDQRESFRTERSGLETLKSLCLTNKLLYSVAQPILYHHLSPFYWNWNTRVTPLIVPFIRTLHQDPSLGEFTKALDMRYIIPAETEDSRLLPLLQSLAVKLQISPFHIPDDDLSENGLGKLIMNMLLCLTPNIETACLGIIPGWDFSLLASVLADKAQKMGTYPLQSLKTLSLTGPPVLRNMAAFRGIDTLLANAPNLQDLRLEELTYCPPGHLIRNIRRLELHHVQLSDADMEEMLHHCTELQEFHYSDISYTSGVAETEVVFGTKIVEALKPASARTLRCLEISYANHAARCSKNTNTQIASLKDFVKLERINLSTAGPRTIHVSARRPDNCSSHIGPLAEQSFSDILPRSVKVFCPPSWPEQIYDLAASVRRDEFPNLERLELEHDVSLYNTISRNRGWMRRRVELKDALIAVGVDVSFAEDRKYLKTPQWHID